MKRGVAWIPGQAAEIPHALQAKKSKHRKQKQYCNKFSKDLKEEKKKLISTPGFAWTPESMDLADESDLQRSGGGRW